MRCCGLVQAVCRRWKALAGGPAGCWAAPSTETALQSSREREVERGFLGLQQGTEPAGAVFQEHGLESDMAEGSANVPQGPPAP